MKLTKQYLRKLIKEEHAKLLNELVQPEYLPANKRPIKVGDLVGNTVVGYEWKVEKVYGGKLDIINVNKKSDKFGKKETVYAQGYRLHPKLNE